MKRPWSLRLADTSAFFMFALAILMSPRGVRATEKGSEQVSSFYGTMGYSVPVEVPSYHGLEPGIALAYNSEGRNGIVGVAGAWPASARSSA